MSAAPRGQRVDREHISMSKSYIRRFDEIGIDLVAGEASVLVGVSGGNVISTPIAQVVEATKPLDSALLELAEVLAR